MAKINRKQALDRINKNYKKIEVKEWDGEVLIKSLSVGEKLAISTLLGDMSEGKNIEKITKEFIKILVKYTFDTETKERIFEDADIDILTQDDTGATETILHELFVLSGIYPDMKKYEEAKEEIEKN